MVWLDWFKLQNYHIVLLKTPSIVVMQIYAPNDFIFTKPCSSFQKEVSHIKDMIYKVGSSLE